jgi:hypothetical protein
MQESRVRFLTLGMLALGWVLSSPGETSAGLQVGGPLTVSVDDSPLGTDFNQTIPLGNGTTTLQADMTVTQTVVSTGPNTQWLVLDFEATGGMPLAIPNDYWSIGANLPLSSPSGFTGAFGYWSVNGAPTNPIYPFGSGFIADVGTDPLNSSISPVYALIFPSSIVNGTTSLDLPNLLFSSPYSFISSGGMDVSAVNGFVIGIQVTNTTAVPEPSSLCLAALGAAIMGGPALIRHRRRARAA